MKKALVNVLAEFGITSVGVVRTQQIKDSIRVEDGLESSLIVTLFDVCELLHHVFATF